MNRLVSTVWTVFNLFDDYPQEVDLSGTACTVFALTLNVFGLFTMNHINGALTIIISLLSISWLVMRNIKEFRTFKKATSDHEAD